MRLLYTIINNFEFFMDIPTGLLHPIENFSAKTEETIIYFKSNHYFDSVLKNQIRENIKVKQTNVLFLPIESLFKEYSLNGTIKISTPITYGLIFNFFEISIFKIKKDLEEFRISEETTDIKSFIDFCATSTTLNLSREDLVSIGSKFNEFNLFIRNLNQLGDLEIKESLGKKVFLNNISFGFLISYFDYIFEFIQKIEQPIFYFGKHFELFSIYDQWKTAYKNAHFIEISNKINLTSGLILPITSETENLNLKFESDCFGAFNLKFPVFYGVDQQSIKRIQKVKTDLINTFLEFQNGSDLLLK